MTTTPMATRERSLSDDSAEAGTAVDAHPVDALPDDGWIRFGPGSTGHRGVEGPLAYGPRVPEESGGSEPHIIRSEN